MSPVEQDPTLLLEGCAIPMYESYMGITQPLGIGLSPHSFYVCAKVTLPATLLLYQFPLTHYTPLVSPVEQDLTFKVRFPCMGRFLLGVSTGNYAELKDG